MCLCDRGYIVVVVQLTYGIEGIEVGERIGMEEEEVVEVKGRKEFE